MSQNGSIPEPRKTHTARDVTTTPLAQRMFFATIARAANQPHRRPKPRVAYMPTHAGPPSTLTRPEIGVTNLLPLSLTLGFAFFLFLPQLGARPGPLQHADPLFLGESLNESLNASYTATPSREWRLSARPAFLPRLDSAERVQRKALGQEKAAGVSGDALSSRFHVPLRRRTYSHAI